MWVNQAWACLCGYGFKCVLVFQLYHANRSQGLHCHYSSLQTTIFELILDKGSTQSSLHRLGAIVIFKSRDGLAVAVLREVQCCCRFDEDQAVLEVAERWIARSQSGKTRAWGDRGMQNSGKVRNRGECKGARKGNILHCWHKLQAEWRVGELCFIEALMCSTSSSFKHKNRRPFSCKQALTSQHEVGQHLRLVSSHPSFNRKQVLEDRGQFLLPVQASVICSSCQHRGVTHIVGQCMLGLRAANRKRDEHLRCDRQQGHQDSSEPKCAKSVPGDGKLSAVYLCVRSGTRKRDLGHYFP